jgi:DNA-binding PadR family transcriptional regulator
MESEILSKMHRKIVESFLDVLILLELKDDSLSSYDVISSIRKRFNVLLNSATVYTCLDDLEREGLITREGAQRRKVYMLTEKGNKTVKILLKRKKKILGLVMNLFIRK